MKVQENQEYKKNINDFKDAIINNNVEQLEKIYNNYFKKTGNQEDFVFLTEEYAELNEETKTPFSFITFKYYNKETLSWIKEKYDNKNKKLEKITTKKGDDYLSHFIKNIKKRELNEEIENKIIALTKIEFDLPKALANYINNFSNKKVIKSFLDNMNYINLPVKLANSSQNPLNTCISSLNKEAFNYFLNEVGVPPNNQMNQLSPLQQACMNVFGNNGTESHIYFIENLLNKKADMFAENSISQFNLPLYYLFTNYIRFEPDEKSKKQLSKIINLFLKNGYPIDQPIFKNTDYIISVPVFSKQATILDCMAALGDIDNLSEILKNKKNITKELAEKMTLNATQNAQHEVLELLNKHGLFDPNYIDFAGDNLAHLLFESFELKKTMFSSRKKQDERDNKFSENKLNDIIKTLNFLKKEKVNLKHINKDGENLNYKMFNKVPSSFLFYTEKKKTFEFIDEILKLKLPLVKKQNKRASPLHLAVCSNSSLPILKHIKDKIKIEPSIKSYKKNNKEKLNLLQEAIEYKAYDNAEFLLSIGFEPFTYDGFAREVIWTGDRFQETLNQYYEKYQIREQLAEKNTLNKEIISEKDVMQNQKKPLRF